jgi:hypothetical protein
MSRRLRPDYATEAVLITLDDLFKRQALIQSLFENYCEYVPNQNSISLNIAKQIVEGEMLHFLRSGGCPFIIH